VFPLVATYAFQEPWVASAGAIDETTAAGAVEFVSDPVAAESSWTFALPVSAAMSVDPSADSAIGPTEVKVDGSE